MNSPAFRRWLKFLSALSATVVILWFAVQWGAMLLRASQANRELHELASALEDYRAQHGTYPQSSDRAVLFETLMQKRNTPGLKNRHQRWINPGHYFYADPDPEAKGNYLLDPWARPYRYVYRPVSRGQGESFLLFSAGPDGLSSDPAKWSGAGRGHEPVDADNFHAP